MARTKKPIVIGAKCEWHEDDPDQGKWDGSCGAEWVLTEGSPTENGMRYCPTCGRPIKERRR